MPFDILNGIVLLIFGELFFVCVAPAGEEKLAVFGKTFLFFLASAEGGFSFVKNVGVDGDFGGETFGHGFKLVIGFFAVTSAVGFVEKTNFFDAFFGKHEAVANYSASVE